MSLPMPIAGPGAGGRVPVERVLAARRVAVVRAAANRYPWALVAIVLTGYALAVQFSNVERDLASGISVFWLPNCVLVTAMVLVSLRLWPAVAVSGMAAEVIGDHLAGIGPGSAMGLGAVNIIEAVAVAAVFLRFRGPDWPLVTVRSVVAFTTAAVGVTVLTAMPGSWIAAQAFGGQPQRAYLSWWLGDGLGLLVGVPVLFTVIGLMLAREPGEVRRLGLLAVLGCLAVAVGIALGILSGSPSAGYLVIAAASAMVMWAGTAGAALASLMLAAVAVYSLNPLDSAGPLEAQVFVIPITVAMLIMGAQVVTMHRQQEALAAANARIAAQAVTDELTGLLNLRGLANQGQAEIARAQRTGTALGVLYADVDGLKQVNDGQGHAAGSAVLVEISEVLRGTFRRTDLVARVGGDEFAVLFPVRDAAEVWAARDRLRARLAATDAQRDREGYHLGLSVGAIMVTPDELRFDDPALILDRLLSQADHLMYQDKTAR